jgi:pyruvate formate lyase activating enzyme
MVSRRVFLAATARSAPALGSFGALWRIPAFAVAFDQTGELLRTAPVARYWTSLERAGEDCRQCHEPRQDPRGKRAVHAEGLVQCLLCAQGCSLEPGQRGRCRSRLNVGGELRSLVYGRPATINVDPIEKKPFYHFLPGASAFSLATSGCPLRCRFCQNWELSQSSPEDHAARFTPPTEIVERAASRQAPVIAFTYNEPTVFTEYLTDIARAATRRGVRSVLVSCGLMREAPLAEMCDVLAAIKIDLKGFGEAFYRDVCGASLAPVLRSLKQIARRGTHLEIVNLVVPTLNDSEPMLRGLADWVLGELGPDVPVHFTRFHPAFQLLNLPPTPVATLERARDIGLAQGLRYVYVGNVPGHPGNHTYCPACRKIVVRRSGFFVTETHLQEGRCAFCRQPVAGVWA